MNSVLFLMPYPLARHKKYDLTSKFDGQMNAMKNLGYDVWYTGYEHGIVYLCHGDNRIELGKTFKKEQNIIQFRAICKHIPKIVKIKSFDLCYMRYSPVIPEIVQALKILKKDKTKIVIEIATYPWKEERKKDKRVFRNFIIYTLSFLFEKKMNKFVDLYTLIGEKATQYGGVKAININNGVDANSISLKTWKNHSNEIHLLALAKMAYWHGYDRVIEGLFIYYSKYDNTKPKIILHLVGNDADGSLSYWKKLVEQYQLKEYVRFQGLKIGNDLNEMYNLCDIGIGSLGIYRKNLNWASSLKISEYCARGIPFVYSEHNNLLNSNLSFCLKVPNDESAIDMLRVCKFADEVRQNKNISIKMHDYAIKNMTWESQFQKIIKSLG